MRAAVYRRYGSADEISIEEVPEPPAGAGEILVRVRAASLNSWDWDKLSGNVYGRLDGPFGPRNTILGADISGVVEAIGDGVTGFAQGDEVLGDLTESGWGGLAEIAKGKAATFVHKPAVLSFAEAACVPQAGLLALQGLREHRPIKAGDAVLINGGGGGMGSFAIQLAKQAGAEVTGVDSSAKLDFMRSLGADHVLDYREEDFATGAQTYNLILDAVARRPVGVHMRALKPGGAYVIVGGTVRSLLQNAILGGWIGRRDDKRAGLLIWRPKADDMTELAGMIATGTIKPTIERVYPLAAAGEALQRLGDGRVLGKAVVDPTV